MEWKRNKEKAFLNIKKLKNKLKQNNPLSDYKKYSSDDIDKIDVMENKYRLGIIKQIQLNELHIENVELFLKKECKIIPITTEMKAEIFDMSISKKLLFITTRIILLMQLFYLVHYLI